MKFEPGFTVPFQVLFKSVQPGIAKSQGCSGVNLYCDNTDDTVFFTISYWESAADLDNYRNSALFTETWQKVKVHFSAKPEAWSLNSI